MAQDGRVVTAKLPGHVFAQLDEVARRRDRSKSWLIRQAVAGWLAQEDAAGSSSHDFPDEVVSAGRDVM